MTIVRMKIHGVLFFERRRVKSGGGWVIRGGKLQKDKMKKRNSFQLETAMTVSEASSRGP